MKIFFALLSTPKIDAINHVVHFIYVHGRLKLFFAYTLLLTTTKKFMMDFKEPAELKIYGIKWTCGSVVACFSEFNIALDIVELFTPCYLSS